MFNTIYQPVIAGLIQGLLEWLPISSSGQVMIFLASVLGLNLSMAYSLSIFLHLGTTFSAIIYFKSKIVRELRGSKYLIKLWFYVTIASIAIGFPLYIAYFRFLESISLDIVSLSVGILLILTGIVAFKVRGKFSTKSKLEIKDFLLLGFIQGLSVIPGVSRSGITITLLLWLGLKPEKAVETSFLASIPVLLLASIYVASVSTLSPMGFIALITSFISGIISISFMISLAKRLPFHYFALAMGLIMVSMTGVAVFVFQS